MLRIGWFATGRGEGSQKLLRAAVEAIREGTLNAEIAFVFSNREPGQFEATDTFFAQVNSYGIPLVTLSDARFRRENGGEVARLGQPLPPWRTEYDRRVVELLEPHGCDLGMLAGYMLITTAPLFSWRPLLNMHPAAPGQPAGHSARRKRVVKPCGSSCLPCAKAAGTSAKPLNGGPPMNLEPVTKTNAPRSR